LEHRHCAASHGRTKTSAHTASSAGILCAPLQLAKYEQPFYHRNNMNDNMKAGIPAEAMTRQQQKAYCIVGVS